MANERSVNELRKHAFKEMELMRQAINEGEYKKAKRHKMVADVVIDDMVNVDKMTETK